MKASFSDSVLLAEPISESHANSLLREAYKMGAGAVIAFWGVVRRTDFENQVDHLFYEAHPLLASQKIREIVLQVTQEYGLLHAKAIHSIGQVKAGETAVFVVTAAGHRRESYEANSRIIDRIKKEVPIWKKEVLVDGREMWSNQQSWQH